MEILYLLLPLSILFVLAIGVAFWWAIFSGQFEGSDEAARSILLDDDSVQEVSGAEEASGRLVSHQPGNEAGVNRGTGVRAE